MMNEIHDLLAKYRGAAAATADKDPKKQNKAAENVRACYALLKKSPDGRQGIIALLTDSSPQVRLWAASHSLAWSPELARPVLDAIRRSGEFPSSFTAEITLAEFEKGTLTFD